MHETLTIEMVRDRVATCGLSQRQLALAIGMSAVTLRRVSRGEMVTTSTLARIWRWLQTHY